MARTDMPHAEVATAIPKSHDFGALANLEAVKRLSGPCGAFTHQYRLEAICRSLCGAVAAYCRTHFPNATPEDILTVAALIERHRSPAAPPETSAK